MADSDQNKLYVGGISRGTTEDALKAHFVKYGAVVAAVVAKDRETGNPRGFGFVSLEDSSAVDRALGDTHCILERMVCAKTLIFFGNAGCLRPACVRPAEPFSPFHSCFTRLRVG